MLVVVVVALIQMSEAVVVRAAAAALKHQAAQVHLGKGMLVVMVGVRRVEVVAEALVAQAARQQTQAEEEHQVAEALVISG